MSTVLVVGAGFSRAISEHAPLSDELGNLVLEELRKTGQPTPIKSFKGGYFESWLSRLGEDQPDLTEYQNYANRALFARVTTAIHEVMLLREAAALSSDPPWWLQKLIGIAHVSRLTLVSFNYDTFIERAVLSRVVFNWEEEHRVWDVDVLNHIPPEPYEPGLRLGTGVTSSFDLIKLHGSLDWYWVPGDSSGATINRLMRRHGWSPGDSLTDAERMRLVPGREPFIVPPAAAKSSFYNNPLMRELWRQAARALSRASQVALVGYSLPATDLVTAGMLADNLAGRPVRIDVVNPAPEPVAQQMERLNLAGDVHCHTSSSAIAEFVDELELSAARNVTQALRQRDTNAPVAVGDYGEGSAVLDLERRADGSVDLVLEERYGSQQVNRSRQEQESDPIRLGNLLARTHESGSASPLCVQWPDGRSSRIVEAGRWRFDTGHEPEWVVLVPSASPHT